MTKRLLIFLLAILVLGTIAGIGVYKYGHDLNLPSYSSIGKITVEKSGVPMVKWFRTDEGFHFVAIFPGGFVAHGTDIFLGAIDAEDEITIRCKKIRESMCGSAELVSIKKHDPRDHQH